MTKYQVDSAEVTQVAELVRQNAASIHSEVAVLMNRLLSLQGSWSGAASSQFASAAEQWRTTQQIVEQSLTQITLALDAAAASYAAAEDDALRLFAQ